MTLSDCKAIIKEFEERRDHSEDLLKFQELNQNVLELYRLKETIIKRLLAEVKDSE